jgi:transglutaminase-like putative cysteine protease
MLRAPRPVLPSEKPQPRQVVAISALYAVGYLPLVPQLAPQVSLYFLLLVLIRAVALRWPGLEPGRWLLLPLTAGAVVNVYHAYHTVVGQQGGTALLASMLGLKLLELRRLRDVRLAAILLCFLLVSQSLFEQSPWLALFHVAVLVLNLALLADLCRPLAPRVPASVRLSLRLTWQAVPLALLLFVLFPRLDAPLWSLQAPEVQARTGVKPWLEPGAISELVVDGSLAFRVRFDGPQPETDDLYWRGPVAWNTDGRRWLPAGPGQFPDQGPGLAAAEDPIAYEVSLERTGLQWLYALDVPTRVWVDKAEITHDFQVLVPERITEATSYRVFSALTYDTGELTLAEEAAGLQLPGNVTDRMRALVAGWKARAQGPEDLVEQGLRFFNRESFHYTLLAPPLGGNPADEFLFETRKGFCEHYASSFALLMRIGGIPSRVVMGYLGGERNPLGGHLIVRQSDAHAWTEVWLQGRGWVRVDPTAAVDPRRVEPSDLFAGLGAGSPLRFRVHDADALADLVHGLRLLADAIDENWRYWVLELSRARQQQMLEWAGLGYLREYGLALAMVLGASVLLALLLIGLVRSDRRRPSGAAERLYERFCRRLGGQGLPRRPSEGPLDYASRVGRARGDLARPAEAFARLYAGIRYGRLPASKANLDRLRGYLGRIDRGTGPFRRR